VFVPESGSLIYVNNELKRETGTFQKELFLQNLKPRMYTVIVANDDFWPWTKDVAVTEKEVSPLYPLLVPRDLDLREIVRATSSAASATVTPASRSLFSRDEYATTLALFATVTPTTVGATSSANATAAATTSAEAHSIVKKKMKVWYDGTSVFAQWTGSESRTPPYFCDTATNTTARTCMSTILVLRQPSAVRHVDFYPGRDDAVIVSSAEGIFAVELDVRAYQNMYPLYQGQNPDFRVDGANVYVRDGNYLGQFMAI
jgi:hypothetical protein